jgi:hypothetical protein
LQPERIDHAKDGAAHIANMSKPADKVRPLWLQPFGLARVFAHDFVALLDNIRDIVFVGLRVLSKNRDSASRGSLC